MKLREHAAHGKPKLSCRACQPEAAASTPALAGVAEDRYEVARGPGQDEEVPDEVGEFQPFQ